MSGIVCDRHGKRRDAALMDRKALLALIQEKADAEIRNGHNHFSMSSTRLPVSVVPRDAGRRECKDDGNATFSDAGVRHGSARRARSVMDIIQKNADLAASHGISSSNGSPMAARPSSSSASAGRTDVQIVFGCITSSDLSNDDFVDPGVRHSPLRRANSVKDLIQRSADAAISRSRQLSAAAAQADEDFVSVSNHISSSSCSSRPCASTAAMVGSRAMQSPGRVPTLQRTASNNVPSSAAIRRYSRAAPAMVGVQQLRAGIESPSSAAATASAPSIPDGAVALSGNLKTEAAPWYRDAHQSASPGDEPLHLPGRHDTTARARRRGLSSGRAFSEMSTSMVRRKAGRGPTAAQLLRNLRLESHGELCAGCRLCDAKEANGRTCRKAVQEALAAALARRGALADDGGGKLESEALPSAYVTLPSIHAEWEAAQAVMVVEEEAVEEAVEQEVEVVEEAVEQEALEEVEEEARGHVAAPLDQPAHATPGRFSARPPLILEGEWVAGEGGEEGVVEGEGGGSGSGHIGSLVSSAGSLVLGWLYSNRAERADAEESACFEVVESTTARVDAWGTEQQQVYVEVDEVEEPRVR